MSSLPLCPPAVGSIWELQVALCAKPTTIRPKRFLHSSGLRHCLIPLGIWLLLHWLIRHMSKFQAWLTSQGSGILRKGLKDLVTALGLGWLRLVRPPLPPYNSVADAVKKVQMAEDAWNTRDPEKVSLAYTEDRNLQSYVWRCLMLWFERCLTNKMFQENPGSQSSSSCDSVTTKLQQTRSWGSTQWISLIFVLESP